MALEPFEGLLDGHGQASMSGLAISFVHKKNGFAAPAAKDAAAAANVLGLC